MLAGADPSWLTTGVTETFVSSSSPASDDSDEMLHSVELTNQRGAFFTRRISSGDGYRFLLLRIEDIVDCGIGG